MRRRFAGFTLIEILVVLAIVAILALIAIANYLTGLERARQKRSMADMRTIATAWEARATELKGYSAAGFTCTHRQTWTSQVILIFCHSEPNGRNPSNCLKEM